MIIYFEMVLNELNIPHRKKKTQNILNIFVRKTKFRNEFWKF